MNAAEVLKEFGPSEEQWDEILLRYVQPAMRAMLDREIYAYLKSAGVAPSPQADGAGE